MSISPDPVRQKLLREAMHNAGLAAVLAWRPEEVLLVSGTFSHLGMTLCLVPQEGEPTLYLPENEPVDMAPDVFLRRRYALRSASGVEAWENLRMQVRQDLQRLGLVARPLGVTQGGMKHALPGNAAETPLLFEEVISYLLDGQQVCNAQALFVQSFQYKTAREKEAIRQANAVATVGLHTFFEQAQPSRTEAEIAGQVEAAIQACSGKQGCTSARAWAFVQAGPNVVSAGTYSRSSGYILVQGDLVVIELGTCVDGYWSDLTRTTCIGAPNQEQRDLFHAVRDAQEAALTAIHPGASLAQVDQAARNLLEQRGYGAGFTHATGHHIGFRYHDEGPMLEPGSFSLLTEGMIITIEPGVYGAMYGGGVRLEDNVYVSSSGPELLSPFHLGKEL